MKTAKKPDLLFFQEKQKNLFDLYKGEANALRALLSQADIHNKFLLDTSEWYQSKIDAQTELASIAILEHRKQELLLHSVIKQLQSGDGTLTLLKEVNNGRDIKRIVAELTICVQPVEDTLRQCQGALSKLVADASI